MKADHFNLYGSQRAGDGNTDAPISKIMVRIRHAVIPLALIFSAALPRTGFAESVDSKIQEGISQYHEGKFNAAGKSFSSAYADRPNDSRIAYNQGNAHYKDGNFLEALQAFTRSSLDEKNSGIMKNSIYNAGNTLVKLGELKKAAAAYKKVLTLDPDDMDAKFNLEYVREQLKKKEDRKQNSDEGDQKNEDGGPSSEKKQGGNREQNEDQQAANQPPSTKNNDGEKNNTEPPKQSEEPAAEDEISEREAERILGRLTEDLKSISRMQAGKTKSSYQGNDW